MTEQLNWTDRLRRQALKFWRQIQSLNRYQLCVSSRKLIKTFSIWTWVCITNLCLKCSRHSRGTVICWEPIISGVSIDHSLFYLIFTTIYHSAVCQHCDERQGSSWRCLRKCFYVGGNIKEFRMATIREPWWEMRRRQWYPTPVLLPGKSHGQRSLVGCSPWGC